MSTAAHTDTTAQGSRFARIVPIAFITYSLAFIDRINYGFAAAGGMGHDLNMDDRSSAAVSASFFLGYFLFQIPGASYASRKSARSLIFYALLLWGGLSALTGVVSSVVLLLIVRFMLGAVEGVVMPAMLVYLMHWFTRAERSRANTFLILGNPVTLLWASVISGYIIEPFGWRAMFIVEGIPSIIWAFVWWRVTSDFPYQAPWLKREHAIALESALDKEQQEIPRIGSYATAFRDLRVLLLGTQLFFWSIGLYGLVLWLPKILGDASKFGIAKVGILSAAPYLCGVLLMVVNSRSSDKSLNRKRHVWPFLLTAAVAFLACNLFGSGQFWPSYGCLVIAGGCLFAGYGPFFAIPSEIIPKNAAGESMALINSFGALGGFAGTYLIGWLNAVTGNASAGFLALSIALAAAASCMLAVRSR